MLLELDATKLFGFNDLHDCVVKSMYVDNNVLTMVVDGSHDSVKHYGKDEIIAEFYLSEDYSFAGFDSVTLTYNGIWRKKSAPSLQEFVNLCNKKYSFEILNIYCNGNAFCIVGILRSRKRGNYFAKATIQIYADKLVYR